jgi:lysozyme
LVAGKNCIDLIKRFEGFYLNAYLCPSGVPTIGYGSTRYENGIKVKIGEKIDLQRAENLLAFELSKIAKRIPDIGLNQNQFDAVCSFCYNVGFANFINSTLFKIMKSNNKDELIKKEFRKWVKARVGGEMRILNGLVRRREAEITLYFNETN